MGRVRRRVLSSASVIEDELQVEGVRYRAALVTATYRSDGTWGPRQITGALKCLKEWARRCSVIHYTLVAIAAAMRVRTGAIW